VIGERGRPAKHIPAFVFSECDPALRPAAYKKSMEGKP
jgi:hypothetical protein